MSKKVVFGVAVLGTLAFLEYRRHKHREAFGAFAYAPLSGQVYNPTPGWVSDPKTPLEVLRADVYIARYDASKLGNKLRRQFVDVVYLANGYGKDFPVSHYPEEKLSAQLVADLRAWAAHYQQHATDLYEYSTSEWDSSEALERHLRDEDALYARLRAEVPFWRRIVRPEAENVVVGRRGLAWREQGQEKSS